jgi:hypothetical protein
MRTKKHKRRHCRKVSHKHCPRCRRLSKKVHLLEKRIDRLQQVIAKIKNSASIGPVSGTGHTITQILTNNGNASAINESDKNSTTNTHE